MRVFIPMVVVGAACIGAAVSPWSQSATVKLDTVLPSIALTSENVAAAGITAKNGRILVASLASETELIANLVSNTAKADLAAWELTAAEQTMADSPTDDAVAAFIVAKGRMETASSSLKAAQDDLFEAALGRLDGEQAAVLSAIRSNDVVQAPAWTKVVSRTPEEWTGITQALRAELRAQRLGEELDRATKAVLQTLNDDAKVGLARQACEAHVAEIANVFADS